MATARYKLMAACLINKTFTTLKKIINVSVSLQNEPLVGAANFRRTGGTVAHFVSNTSQTV